MHRVFSHLICQLMLCSVSCCGVVVSMPVLQVGDLRFESRWQQTFTSYFGSVVCVS